jgi:hypothetical protein
MQAPKVFKYGMRTLTESEKQTIISSGLFDPHWYSATYRDVAATGLDALDHYLRIGIHSGRNPSRLFDIKYYLSQVEESIARPQFPMLVGSCGIWKGKRTASHQKKAAFHNSFVICHRL